MTTPFTIEMLPAAHGDCMWVQFGEGDGRWRLFIDAGPISEFDHVRARIGELAADDRAFDVFVVTHVDTDHIEGALPLLQANDLGVTFDDVWFNGIGHLESGEVAEHRGGVQGEYLASLLAGRSWNAAWDSKAVALDAADAPAVSGDASDPKGAVFTVLSPGRQEAATMAAAWRATCEESKLPVGDVEHVLATLGDDSRYGAGSRGGGDDYGGDGSAANGSSIAFLLEHDGRAVLFTGDAYAEVLTASITKLLHQRGLDRLRLDALKLAHHGSRHNISPELLALLDCDTFLVSTNGAKFKHPDAPTIDLIARSARNGPPTVHFNYRSATTEPYATDTRIKAVYGTDGRHLVTL